MNNVDKNFVYDLSQAITRRFQFISIMPPKDMEKEIKCIKEDLFKRVKNKINCYSNKNINKEFILNYYNDKCFKIYEGKLKKKKKKIRSNDENCLGFPLGTAQIKDLYENIIINMIIMEYDKSNDKEALIKTFIDESVCNMIIPQFENYDLDKKSLSYDEEFSNNENLSWMSLSLEKFYEMIK